LLENKLTLVFETCTQINDRFYRLRLNI